jgi:hypothetical protein
MSNDKAVLEELRLIRIALLSNQSDYCDSKEACRIIGVNNYRFLSQLFQRGLLPRYSRADGYKYKKADLYKVAAKLDDKTIVLEPLNKNK